MDLVDRRNALAIRATVLVLGAGVAWRGGEIAYGPEPGTAVGRSWSEVLRLEIDSLDESLGGEPVDLPVGTVEIEQRRSLSAEDELVEIASGRPAELVRSFDTTAMALAIRLDGRPVGRVEGGAVAEGAVVRFVREDEGYRRERVEDGEDVPLEALDPDLDLLGALPPGPVEEGATWPADPEALRGFFAAGGDVGFRAREAVIEMSGAPLEFLLAATFLSLHELFGPGAEVSGEVDARYAGEEEDHAGARLARIELALDLQAEIDLGERFRAYFEGATEATHACELSGEVEGELVLLWDLGARHLRSARFDGDVALAGRASFPVQPSDAAAAVDFTGEYELSGEAEIALEIE